MGIASRLTRGEPQLTSRRGLSGWTRAGDKDLHQSPGARLPVVAESHMGGSDECSKQVGGLKILANIAAPFRTPHQVIDRSLDQAARILIEPGRASDDAVESGSNDVLGCDVIDEEQHPGPRASSGGMVCASLRAEADNFSTSLR
jgi:hypothetical protein